MNSCKTDLACSKDQSRNVFSNMSKEQILVEANHSTALEPPLQKLFHLRIYML